MGKKKETHWIHCGLYGDKEYTIEIKKYPEQLSSLRQKQLRKLYNEGYNEGYHYKVGVHLIKIGLVAETGNAWNKFYMFAPCVHKWMKKKNNNDFIKQSLIQQYK